MLTLSAVFRRVGIRVPDPAPPPAATPTSLQPGQAVEISLQEYAAIRGEILTSLSNQVSVLSFGAATVGLIVAATATLWRDEPMLAGLLALIIVPAICFLSLTVFLGEQVRLFRAGRFLHELERRLNQAAKPTIQAEHGHSLLTWEQWGDIRRGEADVDRSIRRAITAVFVLLALVFALAGYLHLHSEPDVEEALAASALVVAGVLALTAAWWIAKLWALVAKYREYPTEQYR